MGKRINPFYMGPSGDPVTKKEFQQVMKEFYEPKWRSMVEPLETAVMELGLMVKELQRDQAREKAIPSPNLVKSWRRTDELKRETAELQQKYNESGKALMETLEKQIKMRALLTQVWSDLKDAVDLLGLCKKYFDAGRPTGDCPFSLLEKVNVFIEDQAEKKEKSDAGD